MQVEVITSNGQSHSFHPSTKPQSVELEITAQEIKEQQNRSFVSAADTACRIKIVDEDGDYCWFCVTPVVKRGRVAVEVEAIDDLEKTNKKKVTGRWKKADTAVV